MHPQNQSRGGLLLLDPPRLTQPARPLPTSPADDKEPLIVLFDPTSERETTARRLTEVGGWRVMGVDTSRSEILVQALDTILGVVQGGSLAQYKPAAFVLESSHPQEPLVEFAPPPPPKTAWQLLDRLTRFHSFEGVPVVLYTADQQALRRARTEYAASRQHPDQKRPRFDGTLERNDRATASDLALAQLLQCLIAGAGTRASETDDDSGDLNLPF